MIFSEAVSTEFFETADKITPPVKSPAPQWMQPDTRKAIKKKKKDVRKKHGDTSSQYKIAKAETKKN